MLRRGKLAGALQAALDLFAASPAGLLKHLPSALEDKEIGDALDAVAFRKLGVLLGIDLEEDRLASHFPRQAAYFRSGNPAGTAPGCPEVDQHGDLRFGDDGFKHLRVGIERRVQWGQGRFARSATPGITEMPGRNPVAGAAGAAGPQYGVGHNSGFGVSATLIAPLGAQLLACGVPVHFG